MIRKVNQTYQGEYKRPQQQAPIKNIISLKVIMGNTNLFSSQPLKRRVHYNMTVNLLSLDTTLEQYGINSQQGRQRIDQLSVKVKATIEETSKELQSRQIVMPALSEHSQRLITEYFSSLNSQENEYTLVDEKWRFTQCCQDIQFFQHQYNTQKYMDGHVYFGTEIFLPPKNFNKVQGGDLNVLSNKGQRKVVLDETKWTHIVLPQYCRYWVSRVTSGRQLVLERDIWVRQGIEIIQTDQDRISREQKEKLATLRKRQRPHYLSQQVDEEVIV